MKILIVSHFYEVDGVMGSVRWTSFAHRLVKNHEVVVVTHGTDTPLVMEYNEASRIRVIHIDNECEYVKRGQRKRINKRSTANRQLMSTRVHRQPTTLKSIVREILYVCSMRSSARKNAARLMRVLKDIDFQPDCVVTTSRPFIDAFLGFYIVKDRQIPWVFDQRDLQYNDGAPEFTVRLYKWIFHRMDRYVSMYTLVSNGMAQSFIRDCGFSEIQSHRVRVLTNGFAREYKTDTERNEMESLIIAYAGDLYAGRRDAGILFAAIRRLLSRSADNIWASNFCIRYVGDEGEVLRREAARYGLEDIIIDEGRVSHIRAVQIQVEADLLLLLTWNTEMDQGILPGKLYEYMMAERPVICITCGSVPDGEAERMVKRMNLGIAVNQINEEKSINELASFLEDQLNRKKHGEELLYLPDKAAVNTYDYDSLTQGMESLLMEVVK